MPRKGPINKADKRDGVKKLFDTLQFVAIFAAPPPPPPNTHMLPAHSTLIIPPPYYTTLIICHLMLANCTRNGKETDRKMELGGGDGIEIEKKEDTHLKVVRKK